MSINNVDKLLRNFQNYLMRQNAGVGEDDFDVEELDKSFLELANNYKSEFETYLKNNASGSVFDAIFSDGKIDDKDLNYLSTASIGADGKIKGLNEINNYAMFSIDKSNEETEITPEIEQAAQASGMDPKAFVQYAQDLGFSADEFASSVNELVNENQEAVQTQESTDTEASETTEEETATSTEENVQQDATLTETSDVETADISNVDEVGDVSEVGDVQPTGATSTDETTASKQESDDIASIQDEYNSTKSEFDNAQNEYATLVNGDEYLTQNPDGKNSYASQIAKNLQQIQETETKRNEAQQEVSNRQTQLNDTTVAYNTAQTNLDSIMDNISELKTQLKALGKTSGDEYNALSNLLNEAIFEKLKAQSKLKEAKDAKDKAQENLDSAKGNLDKINGNLTDLEQAKQSLDEVVQSGQNEALKTALQNYNNMKSELDSIQTKMEKTLDTQESKIPQAKELNLYDGSDEVLVEASSTEAQNQTTNPTSSANPTSPSYTGGGSGGVGGSGSPSSSATTVTVADNLKDLEDQQAKYQGEVDKATNELSTAQSKGQEKIDSAQKGYDSAKDEFDNAEQDYQDAVSNDDFLNSNPKNGKSYAEQISENLDQIQEAETNKNASQQEISIAQGGLNDTILSVNTCQTTVNNLQANKTAIDNAVSTYDPKEGEDYDIAVAKQKELEDQLNTAKEQLSAAQEAKDTAEKNLEAAKDKYEKACDSLEEAEKTKQELDSVINSNQDKLSEATLDALERYNTAKENLDKAETEVEQATQDQTAAVEQARKNLETQQINLDTINQKLDEMQAQDIVNEYSSTTLGEKIINFAQQFIGRTEGDMSSILAAAGLYDAGQWCADFVSYCLQQNGINVAEHSVSGLIGWGQANGTYVQGSEANETNVKPGDIVVWKGTQGFDSHTGIVTSIYKENGVYYYTTLEGNMGLSDGVRGVSTRETCRTSTEKLRLDGATGYIQIT